MGNEQPRAAPLSVHRDCPRCGGEVPAVDLVTECPHCGYEIRNPRPVPLTEHPTISPLGQSTPVSEPHAQHGQPDPLVGSTLGVYRIDAFLGRGGMGRVYLAHHRDLHRACALKILPPELAEKDPDFVERFLNEGRAAAALVHPNIITVHAVGRDRDLYYLEMEFVPGRSLWNLIEDEQRVAPLRATAMAARIADGLAEAHRAGVIHRDLKPENVLLTLQGVPKIADFGLAKRLVATGPATLPEGLCGTPHFMAPELFQGAPSNPATDVYALGVTLYQMIAGRLPFQADSLVMLVGSLAREPLPSIRRLVPEVSLELAEVIEILLERNPANRPRDAVKAAQLLQAVLGQSRDLDTLIAQAFRDDRMVRWAVDGRRFRVEVFFADGRRQIVHVEPSSHAAAERLLLIMSTCCDAQPSYYEQALRINAEMPHGSISVREIDGRPSFVVGDTYPRATVDSEEIRRSVHEVARRADAIEKLLTGRDYE
jgi:serine/threonine-protein kinase